MLERTLQDICTAAGWTYLDDRAQIPLPVDRHQEVAWCNFEADGQTLIRLASVIGSASALNEARLTAALRLNANLRFGALAIVDDELAVVDTFLVSEADAAELEASMRYIAETADRYESAIFGTDVN